VNQSGFIRNILKNQDSGPTTTILQTLENDLGYQFSMGLTSSTFNTTGPNRNNRGVISLNSPSSMGFLIRYNKPFSWVINPANDGDLLNQTEIMRLEPEGNLILPLGGINTSGNITTIGAGFFGFLGSLTSRTTKLFVQDIDASGNINASNYTLNGTTITDWDEISSGKSLTAGGVYLYNDSNSVYLNETKLNSTIDARATTPNLTNYALKNQSEIFTGNITTTQTGFFGYLGSLTSKITQLFVQQIDVSTNATIEALIIKRYDAFGPVILLNSTADAIRIYAAPNITNPAQGAGIQVFGNAEGFFPGDVYIDSGSTSGGQIIMRTGTTGLNDRMIVEDDGRVRILNLTGSGNDYVCVDANGYLFRSNTAC